MVVRTGVLGSLGKERLDRLMPLAREVTFAAGERLFDEGGRADRFWIIDSGTVALDVHIPGRRAAVVERLGPGELVGWSWLIPPHHWHLGAQAVSSVRAHEFDADAVRELCAKDPELDHALLTCVASLIAERLRASRGRLTELSSSPRGGVDDEG